MPDSRGVIGAVIAIYFTKLNWTDPIVAIGLWVLPRTWTLLSDTTHILLQRIPRGFDLKAIRAAMGEVSCTTGVHDLHLWSVAGNDASLAAHVAVEGRGNAEIIRRALTEMLESRFAIHHPTIQTETELCGDGRACTNEGSIKIPGNRNDSIRLTVLESLYAIHQKSAGMRRTQVTVIRSQSAKTSTQFLHRLKMAYFYQLYQ